jgi:hypothetical protein
MAGGKVFMDDVKTPVWLEGRTHEDNAGSSDKKQDVIRLDSIYYNQFPKTDGLYVFTPSYGSESRAGLPNLSAVVSDGEVKELVAKNGSCEIPADGFLVSAIGDYAESRLKSVVKAGMNLEIKHETITGSGNMSGFDWAYECGSWILKNGEIIVPSRDNWVGTLMNRTPRTAVGIKKDGTLIFVVVDGRQKGLSDGLTGREFARELLELGINDAAFLDGGASSEMIVDGRIVNSPSAGRERMIASCFVVKSH